nr:hypothetical protein [Tanacetum cinerariifolium]
MDVEIEQDDLNQKFFNSLAPEWLLHMIVWRNRSDLDTMILDYLYNHLKVYESEVQKKSEPNSQNMAFISSAKHSKGNEDVNTASVSTASTNIPTYSANDMALLSMRANRFWKKTRKKISIQGSDVAGFDKLKVECFNYHKMGHLPREYRAPKSQERGRRDNYKQESKVEEKSPKALMVIDGVRWDWSYMANDEENHLLVADKEAPSEFALMANTSAKSKLFDNSLCFKDCKKNTNSLNSKITDLTDKLFDAKGLEYKTESSDEYIEILKKELELIKKEKEGLDGKLAGFQTASKDLDSLLKSQRLDKNKEGLGYSAFPPLPAQIYSSPKKDLSWTGLPEFKVDTITDYSRPVPTIESSSDDAQNRNPSVIEEASPSTITPKSFIKFVKANDSPTRSKIDKAKKAKKSPVKYNLVRGLPTKCFENDHTCTACLKGKQHKASLDAGTNSTNLSGTKDAASQEVKKDVSSLRYIALPNWVHDPLLESSSTDQMETLTVEAPIPTISSLVPTTCLNDCPEPSKPKKIFDALQYPCWVEAMQEELLQFKIQNVWTLVDCPKEAIRLFLAYASFMGLTVYQMDVKSAFLYGTIDEEVYVMQPPRFQDPEFPARVYKVEKAMYELHQAPRAWYGTLSKYLLTNGFQRVKRIFRYLKGHPKLGLWYPKESPFDLVAYSDSYYGGATQDMVAKFEAQEMEINRLKAKVKLLEDREGVVAERSGDDAPIKGRNLDEGEAVAERVSNDTKEMVTVLTSMETTTVLASRAAEVPTGSGLVPTAGSPAAEVPTGSDVLVPIEEVYVEALQVKHLIIDWKVHTEGQRSYWKIMRLGGSSASYQFFVDLLKHMEREDLNQLWALVKDSLSNKPPTSDKEMELWVELKRLYEPDDDTQNQMHAPVEWKLYDMCGVHQVTSKDKEIFILVEKDYPLRKGLAIVMIYYKLQVENYSQMANDLILKIYKIVNCPSQQGIPTASYRVPTARRKFPLPVKKVPTAKRKEKSLL